MAELYLGAGGGWGFSFHFHFYFIFCIFNSVNFIEENLKFL